MLKKYLSQILIFLNLLLISYAIYLSYIGGYGSDEDTLPMIGSFEALYNYGEIMTSRFTGYPVAEFGIGFLSYYFGSFHANLATFSLLIISIYFIFLTFADDDSKNKINFFFLLCLSNPIIFFDNIEPIDYSWALAPFSIACFLFTKKRIELALLFFVISIGARINFGLFMIFFILFYNSKNEFNLLNKFYFIFTCLFCGSLFYLPIWYQSELGLQWLNAARPTDQGFFGLLARFLYKIIHLITPMSLLFIMYIFFKENLFKKLIIKNNQVLLFVILSNLILFLWIPAELSYLQLGIILFYLFLLKSLKKKLILLLIMLNFLTWFVQFDFLRIEYFDDSVIKEKKNTCAPLRAIGAKFHLSLKKGAIEDYFYSRDMIKCWIDENSDRGKKILEGKALKSVSRRSEQ